MKKLVFLLLGFSITSFSQNQIAKNIEQLEKQRVSFVKKNVLNITNDFNAIEENKVVDNATFAKINTTAISEIISNNYDYLEIEIPYNNQNVTLSLYKVNLFAQDFHVDTDVQKNINYEKGVYYRGIVKGDYTSVASFNFFNNELNGVISSDTLANLVVGKLHKSNNVFDYIVYSDANLKVQDTFDCAFKDENGTEMNLNNSRDVNTTRCVTMYFEVDNDIYQSNSNSTTQTTNWMTSVFNNVQTLYANDNITIALKSMFIWTTQDPYDGIGNSSADYLFKFNEVRPIFDGDVGQLVGIDSGGLGGVAVGIDGICTQTNFSYSDVNFNFGTVPTYSWTINVISHEFGHLLGSRHTHGCWWNGNNTAIDGCGQQAGYQEGNCAQAPIPSTTVKGTIMSYCHLIGGVGVNFNNGFGPQPRTAIQNSVDSGLCLSTDCVNTCINTVYNINFTTVTQTSASITWLDDSATTSWQVAVFPLGENPTTWITANTESAIVNGLTPNTYYIVRVRPFCTGGLESNGSQLMFVTGTNFCSGTILTDTGGAFGDYNDNETVIRVLIPNLPNNKITLTFTEFDLELDYDYLYVYDGNSVNASLMNPGGSTGSNIPGPFTSTASDGSLTVKFYSDGGVIAPGYVANTTCTSTLSNTQFNGIDFSYYPNPTNGIVNLISNTEMNKITVYNISGQLLYKSNVNDLNTNVDISSFATGTYFFKINFGEKEVNFKVLKM